MDWVRACKEDADDRVLSASDFSEAGPFNEMVVMGVLAVRLQGLNQVLEWDGPNMRFTNIPDDAMIKTVIKDGFHIKDGHPTFDKTWTDPVNAQQFAQELIKHTYRDGWALPAMRWAAANGVVNGVGDSMLEPQGQATRAQFAKIIMVYLENLA